MVDCDSLCNIIERLGIGKIKLMKIDVEGHEESVLNGMAELLNNNPPLYIY
jgi:FkbM family methyltransferase